MLVPLMSTICGQLSTMNTKHYEFAVAVVLSLLSGTAMFAVIGLIEWGVRQVDLQMGFWSYFFLVVLIWRCAGAALSSFATHRIFDRRHSSPVFWGCFLGVVAPYFVLFVSLSQGPGIFVGPIAFIMFRAAIPFIGAAAVGAHLGSRDCRRNRTGD